MANIQHFLSGIIYKGSRGTGVRGYMRKVVFLIDINAVEYKKRRTLCAPEKREPKYEKGSFSSLQSKSSVENTFHHFINSSGKLVLNLQG